MSSRTILRWLALPILAALCWALPSALALAAGPEPTKTELLLPAGMAVGVETALNARVSNTSAGGPIAGVEVIFARTATFMNTESEIVLGKVATDKQGIATLPYTPRSEGEVGFAARFSGSTAYQPSSASLEAQIATGPAQYVESAGVRVKGVNVMWLVAVLGGVWSIYFTVMGLLALIAREGQSGPQPGEA